MMRLSEWVDEHIDLFEGLRLPNDVSKDDVYIYLKMKHGNREMRETILSYEPADVFVYINLKFAKVWKEYEQVHLGLGVSSSQRTTRDEQESGTGNNYSRDEKFQSAMNTPEFLPKNRETVVSDDSRKKDKNVIIQTDNISNANITRQLADEYGIINLVVNDIAGLIGNKIY